MKRKKNIKSFGIDINQSAEEIVKELRQITDTKIIEKTMLFKDWDYTFPLPWKPVIDKNSKSPFMPFSFEEAIAEGNFDKDIPILAGVTGEEGLIITAPFLKSQKRWNLFFQDWKKWAPQLLFNRETDLINENDISLVDKIFEHYFPIEHKLRQEGNSISVETETDNVNEELMLQPHSITKSSTEESIFIPSYNDANLKKMEEIVSTAWFHAPLQNDLEKLVKSGVRAYTFKFSYQGTFSFVDVFRLPVPKFGLNLMGHFLGWNLYRKNLGACHTDDIRYIFPMKMLPKLSNGTDTQISKWLTKHIGNFSKNGNPTPSNNQTSETRLFEWPLVQSCDTDIVIIDKDGSNGIRKDDDVERNKCWYQFYKQISFSTTNRPITILYDNIAEDRNRSYCI